MDFPIPLIPLRFRAEKTAEDFHARFQFKAELAGFIAGLSGRLVCAFRHPDFVAGLRIFQPIL